MRSMSSSGSISTTRAASTLEALRERVATIAISNLHPGRHAHVSYLKKRLTCKAMADAEAGGRSKQGQILV